MFKLYKIILEYLIYEKLIEYEEQIFIILVYKV